MAGKIDPRASYTKGQRAEGKGVKGLIEEFEGQSKGSERQTEVDGKPEGYGVQWGKRDNQRDRTAYIQKVRKLI